MQESRIKTSFKRIYGKGPEVLVRAPCRINLIGEHTDYNAGFVLPAAINKSIYFGLAKRHDSIINLYSLDLEECLEINLNNLFISPKPWANFLIGVIKELKDNGSAISQGFDLVFGGNVPLGAGMSSSAAMESGIGFALNQLYNLNLGLLDLALIAQKAEHNFAGVNCGIMDMYASLFGKEKHLIKLDCRDLTHEYLPFDLSDLSIVLFNTGVKHNLADSEYNKRREECEEGVAILKNHYSDLTSLRDVSLARLENQQSQLPKTVYKRCHYVISETERMIKASGALQKGDLTNFGKLMFETHKGLKEDYEVSCTELDFLVNRLKNNESVLGSRMMGGGFGGCTINLIRKGKLKEIVNLVKEKYLEEFDVRLEHYIVKITDGCTLIDVVLYTF